MSILYSASQTQSEIEEKFNAAMQANQEYIQQITRDIKNIKKSKLKIYVATMRTCSGVSACAECLRFPD